MFPIGPSDSLRVGDVVHHPAFGFASVIDVDERGASLRLSRERDQSPTHVARHGLATSWRRCRPGGLLARHVTEPDAVRALGKDDPVALLGLLLADLPDPQPVGHAQDWMREVVGESGFDGWWSAVLALAGVDGRFILDDGCIALSDDTTGDAFDQGSEGVEDAEMPEPTPVRLDVAPARADATTASLWTSALGLARALAQIHALGQNALRDDDRASFGSEGWSVASDTEHAPPSIDVAWAMRRFAQEALGARLPAELESVQVVDLLPAAVPSIAPELLGVMRMALARDAALRPSDGLALCLRLGLAYSASESRRTLPLRPTGHIRAGFDTHIGTVKSLASQANQDAFLLAGEPQQALFCVADGISTASAGTGDLASSLAIRTLRLQWTVHAASLKDADDESVHKFLRGAMERANRLICESAARIAGGDLSRHVPMGTTAVVGVTRGDLVRLAAVGDSRAYIVGRHGVAPLLFDQNLNAVRLRQVASGGTASWDRDGYALVGYLGHFDELGEALLPPLFTRTFRLLPGEWLIIASDGLSDHAADEEAAVYTMIERAVAESSSRPNEGAAAMSIARRLTLAANEGTGGDNVTVLALTLGAEVPR